MKPNWYAIITRAVEEGVKIGYHRAHKHTDYPEESVIEDYITSEVMNQISEVVEWTSENS